jgi:hypothetical protein
MKSAPLLPFFTIDPSAVAWSLNIGGVDMDPHLPVAVEDWHPGASLEVQLGVEFDHGSISANLSLQDSEPKYGLYLTAYSPGTGFKWVSDVYEVENGSAEVKLSLPPHVFSLNLKLEALLVILSRQSGGPVLAPPVNAVCARSQYVCELEGALSRPTVVRENFTESSLKNAMWLIDTSFPSELEEWLTADISTSVVVRLNSAKLEQLGSETAYHRALHSDFIFAMIEGALSDDDIAKELIEANQATGQGSLWITAQQCLRNVFGDSDLFSIQNDFSKRRSAVRSKIQSVAADILEMK